MKKMTTLLLLFIAILFTSCGEKNTQEVTPPVKHVIVVGDINSITPYGTGTAYLWKDGVGSPLTEPGTIASVAGVCIVDDIVYVVGSVFGDNDRAVYWRNGEKVILSNTESQATGIAVDGKDIYILGYASQGDKMLPCYWKNGIKSDLSIDIPSESYALASNIKVQSGKVYITINLLNLLSDRLHAYCYEDGVLKKLSDSSGSYASDVYLNGNDVYYAGMENKEKNIATYWKNGVATALSDGLNNAGAYAMVVSGQDVLVAGTETFPNGHMVAKLWKNGVATTLPSDSEEVSVTSMYLDGDDVYITGYARTGSVNKALLWKNGKIVPLAGGEANGVAWDVVVYTSTK